MFKFKLVTLALLSAMLNGCVNFDAVGKFANGAQMLAQASGEFYQTELETDRKLAGLTVNLDAPVQPGQSPWQEATAGTHLISEARRNRAAVEALASYASSLQDIATFDNEHGARESAHDLSKNLGKLARALDSSANPDESALASAITSLATLFTDIEIKKTLHQKVKQAQPYVEKIVEILVGDIKRQQQRYALTRLAASAQREQWFNSFKEDFISGQLSASQKSFVAMAAGGLVEAELTDKLAEQPARDFLDQLKITADSCLVAHQAIRNTDLKADAKELISFVGEARRLLVSVRDLK